ncbi:hypothetical protein MNBD_ALPHA06-1291 [hydrothermal vent metagenome]|uniref:SH3b domain-containing protein n=1 Tax=hydrothermal vent metagenome TaxID=652676 RepID=A0A3B0RQ35_9ZZZZ
MTLAPILLSYLLWQTPMADIKTNTNQPEKPVVWASIAYVNTKGRKGPGLQYPIVWVYNPKGLPVQVLRRASEWSQVKDMQGEVLWMANRVLEQQNTALVIASEPVPLIADSRKRNKVLVRLAKNVVVNIQACEAKQCLVRVRDKKGWVDKTALWGPVQTRRRKKT